MDYDEAPATFCRDCEEWRRSYGLLRQELKELEREIEGLRKENERLRRTAPGGPESGSGARARGTGD